MKIKNIIASGLFCSLSAQVSANTFNAPLVEQSLLLDAATATNIVVVGERSHVILSDDNGTTFTQASLPLTTTLTAVAAHGQKLWVSN